ncbi:putative acyltransferase family protein [Blattamonas nauphoetae]|uniref:Acyltransferase family protein n=1 Tax=Blattamonas nauphoetae TaxID=2049346 RepID=A0ABQ9Y603_9EUKA|nr:putative acyltransferase family protein [Blattamonas nauphoetae]
MESVAQSEEQNEILLVKPVRDRNYALDLLRTIASFMVVLIHAAVFYYSCPFLSICQGDGPVWAGVLTALCRSSVPLFVMMTGYFVVPVKENSFSFVKKRFKRVFIPYFFWCVVYAGYNVIEKKMTWIGFFEALIRIPLNYGTDVGHLWYVQMSIGLDLFLPIISPWVLLVWQTFLYTFRKMVRSIILTCHMFGFNHSPRAEKGVSRQLVISDHPKVSVE